MKTLIASLLFLVACGGDSAPVKHKGTITCDATCDAMSASTTIAVCDTDEHITAQLTALVDNCEAEAVSSHCMAHTCQCSIPDVLPECQ